MDSISIMYCLIIFILVIIRIYQKSYNKKNEKVRLSRDFRGVDLYQLKCNYEILNKMLDEVKLNNKKYEEQYKQKCDVIYENKKIS